jgi:hypothetical protein
MAFNGFFIFLLVKNIKNVSNKIVVRAASRKKFVEDFFTDLSRSSRGILITNDPSRSSLSL